MLKVHHFTAFQLELEFIGDEGDKLGIGGLALGVGNGVAEEPLEGIQIPPIPGHLDGVADGPFHPAGGKLFAYC